MRMARIKVHGCKNGYIIAAPDKIMIDSSYIDEENDEIIVSAFSRVFILAMPLEEALEELNAAMKECDCEKGHVRGTRLSWMDKDTKFYKRSDGTWLAVEPNGDQWTALTKDSNLWEETD